MESIIPENDNCGSEIKQGVWLGKTIIAEIRRYWLKRGVKFSNPWLGYNVWSSTELKKCVMEVE